MSERGAMPQPQWTEPLHLPKTGRDHLGLLEVSSGQILPSLSPAIIVVTNHPRYHSFYAFILQEFWERDLPRTPKAFKRFYRPIEFVFSVGVQQCDRPTHGELGGIIGSQRTAALARSDAATYDPTYEYIQSSLGGYGLYYRGVMDSMGFIVPGGLGIPTTTPESSDPVTLDIDVPTPRGTQLAHAFREAVRETEYFRKHLASTDPLPRTVVTEFGRAACLCGLSDPDAPDRDLLLGQFLHHGDGAPARRSTFRMLLDIAEQTDGHPMDAATFRRLVYLGYAGDAKYAPLPEMEPTHYRWRLYQAREYYAFALNALWAYFCDWGLRSGGDFRPLPLQDFYAHIDESLDFDSLAQAFDLPQPALKADSRWVALLEWLTSSIQESAERANGARVFDEHRLYELIRTRLGEPVLIPACVALLGLIASRFSAPSHQARPEWEVARMGRHDRLSLNHFLRDLRSWRAEEGTVSDVMRPIIQAYIVRQHLTVARSKLPENTLRFEREDGGLRFYPHSNQVTFADSRYDSLSTHLHELGLCGDFAEAAHAPTPEGHELLRAGDLK